MNCGSDQPYWGFSTQQINDEGTRISFIQQSTSNKAGKDFFRKYKWNDVLGCIYGHTFDLTCDYQRRPSWIKMTDVDNPTNVITLFTQPTYFMPASYYND